MTDNLFSEDKSGTTTTTDETKNYLSELVGEGKKFSDPEALARGKYEADRFIEFKNREFDDLKKDFLELREKYNARATLEEVLDRATKSTATSDSTTNANVETQPVIDPKQIESLVDSKIAQRETERQHAENFKQVMGNLKEQYGQNWQSVLRERMESLGLDEAFVNDLARRHPTAFMRTFTASDRQTETFQAPATSTFKPTSSAGKQRTWAYYQNMKKSDPKTYYDPKTQVQLIRDAETLGDSFKDGDYNN